MSTSVLSARSPSGSSLQRTVSHEMIARPSAATVYTFSFTTLWFQTVNAVAPMIAASAPPVIRCQRSGSHVTSTRSATRNHIAAEKALASAASRLILTATLKPPSGSSANVRPRMTKSGLPGGCGRPKTYAAAMYSLVSHIAVLGARVRQ